MAPPTISLPNGHLWIGMLGHEKGHQEREEAFEVWCYRRLPRVSWMDKCTNYRVMNKIGGILSLGGLWRMGESFTVSLEIWKAVGRVNHKSLLAIILYSRLQCFPF